MFCQPSPVRHHGTMNGPGCLSPTLATWASHLSIKMEMFAQSVFLKLRPTVLWGSVNVLGVMVLSKSPASGSHSDYLPGAPHPLISPAVWCRATSTGSNVRLLLPVCQGHWRLDSKPSICRCILRSSSLRSAGLVLSINYYCATIFTLTPNNNNKTNQHLCICIYRQGYRLV